MKSLVDTVTLHNGVQIPIVGFGTWQTPNDEVGYQAVLEALKVGYRHIDTAAVYGNEASVGRAIKDSKVPRDEIFLTTKLWNDAHGYEATRAAFDQSLERLGVDYVDLYLIHWPNPLAIRDCWAEQNAGSWKAMEALYQAGKIKAIGVSNFLEHHIEELMKTATIAPMVNQIRLCPGDTKDDLVAYCRKQDMVLEAYSPLGTGKVFEVPELKALAQKYQTTVAKLCLRWSLQMGFLPLPKSITSERIESNSQLFDFEISDEDMTIFEGLTGCCGISDSPDEKTF